MNESKTVNLYRIYHLESCAGSGDRSEIGRVSAYNIDDAIEHVKAEYLKPTTIIDMEDGDDEHIYLMLDICSGCEIRKNPLEYGITQEDLNDPYFNICEECELNETIEISLDNDADPSYRVIFPYGQNNYKDLTQGDK